jgi:hypothetical protein
MSTSWTWTFAVLPDPHLTAAFWVVGTAISFSLVFCSEEVGKHMKYRNASDLMTLYKSTGKRLEKEEVCGVQDRAHDLSFSVSSLRLSSMYGITLRQEI